MVRTCLDACKVSTNPCHFLGYAIYFFIIYRTHVGSTCSYVQVGMHAWVMCVCAGNEHMLLDMSVLGMCNPRMCSLERRTLLGACSLALGTCFLARAPGALLDVFSWAQALDAINSIF